MFSVEYGDWLTSQWWFWALIAVGSLVAGLLAGQLISWQTHRRRRNQIRREFEAVAQDTMRLVNAFLAARRR